jgi:hypothetical protein
MRLRDQGAAIEEIDSALGEREPATLLAASAAALSFAASSKSRRRCAGA